MTIVVAMVTAAVTAGGPVVAATLIGTDDLRNGAVTTPKLADGAVSAAKIATAAVRPAHLADGAITAPKLRNGSVGADKLRVDAVTSDKIADGQVRAAHLGALMIQTVSVDLMAGTTGGGLAICPEGTRVISGGHRASAGEGVHAVSSYMDGNGWLVYLKNTSTGTITVDIDGYCLDE